MSNSFIEEECMINTYDTYLKHPAGNILTIEDAMRIYEKMAECIRQCTIEDKMDFWNDCLKKAARYAKIRNDWETMSREEKIETDSNRTSAHDSIITAINVLSRIAEREGIDNSWRTILGDNRKRIGDYACFISYITGISNR